MITILNTNKFIKENKLKGPIDSPLIFQSNTQQFHPQGLHSEDIFGLEGTLDRKTKLSWINLNCHIITPSIYDILAKRIMRNIVDLLSGEVSYKIDSKHNLVPDEDGDIIGYSSLIENIHNVKFRSDDEVETDRNAIINMIEKNIKENTFFMDKLIVISPEYRPVIMGDSDRDVMIDEMNDLYTKIIVMSSQLQGAHGHMKDVLTFKMQLMVKDLYEYLKTRISKKHGLMRDKMLGKRVDLSGRSVISTNPNLSLGYIGIPFKMAVGIFEPYILYGLVNSKESRYIPDEFHTAVKDFLFKEKDSFAQF
jgi:hypothetical protein